MSKQDQFGWVCPVCCVGVSPREPVCVLCGGKKSSDPAGDFLKAMQDKRNVKLNLTE